MADYKDIFSEACTASPEEQTEGVKMQVCWYGERIGTACMTEDGLVWCGYASDKMERTFAELLPIRKEDRMPQFLVNLEPEHEVFSLMGIHDKNNYLSTGLRFLSNFTISQNAPYDLPVGFDELQGHLDDFSDEKNIFQGRYISELPHSFEEEALHEELTELWSNRYAPRYSGQETKIPVSLTDDGALEFAITKPFTHFLKLPSEGVKEGWGVNEWMCMELSEAAGLKTAKHALVFLGEDIPPAYIVERFDIEPRGTNNGTKPIMHDLCTIDGMRPLKGLEAQIEKEGLAIGSIEKIAPVIAAISTDPQQDMETFFKRTLVSWVVGDDDMHRKNVSMLFHCDPETGDIVSARIAPAYDITSEVHRDRHEIGMTLRVNGKNSRLKKKDFQACAAKMGISPERAEEITEETITSMANRAVDIANDLPKHVTKNIMCNYTANRIATIVVQRAKAMGYETPEWEETVRVKNSKSGLTQRLGGKENKIDMSAFKL